MHRASELTTTAYGLSLFGKLALVLVTVALAAHHRWRRLPQLRREGKLTAAFQRSLRLEGWLLTAVLVATSVLSTRPMPH